MPRSRINWKSVIEEAKSFCSRYLSQYGTPPTLRGVFYALVSRNVIPNTVSAYKRLSAVLAQARYNGNFPWGFLKDETREYYLLEPSDRYMTKELSEEELKELILQLIEAEFDVSVNPWLDQEWRVVVILEKKALADSVRVAIRQAFPWGVHQLRVIRGYDSASDAKAVADQLSTLLLSHNVAVLILSDFDPSGEDLARDFERRVRMLLDDFARESENQLVFEKVAIRPEQILELNIPPAPESADELKKLRRDPRYRKFMERLRQDERLRELVEIHGIVRAELDALLALHHDEFVRILGDAIRKYWSDEIFENVTRPKMERLQREAEEAKRRTLEKIRRTLGDVV